MNQNTNQVDSALSDEDFLIAKTDTQGVITYVNRNLMRASGYLETELLDQTANILRHPEMPRGLFDMLWKTVQAKREFNCYLKNLCQDGGFFWVFANITPSMSLGNHIDGYSAIYRKPKQKAIDSIEPLYEKMLTMEKDKNKESAIQSSSKVVDEWLNAQQVCYEEYILAL